MLIGTLSNIFDIVPTKYGVAFSGKNVEVATKNKQHYPHERKEPCTHQKWHVQGFLL